MTKHLQISARARISARLADRFSGRLAAGLALSVLALSVLALPAAAQELQYSTHLPPVVAVNSNGIQPLLDGVAAASNGEVTVKYFWAGQLFNAAGNFEAVRDGVVDMAFTQPNDNQADMAANMLFADMYFLGGDSYVTAAAMNETILLNCESCRQEYAESNALFMGAHAATPTYMVCAKPLTSMADLNGSKVIGQTTLAGFVQSLGGTQLDVPPPGRMEAMSRGVADCTLISPEWLDAFSIGEVAQTIVEVPTGSQFAISIATTNIDSWNGMSDAVKTAFLQGMPKAIAGITDTYAARDITALENARAKGTTITTLDGSYRAALDAYLVGYEDRIIADAKARGVDDADVIVAAFKANLVKWQALIDEKGTETYADLLWDQIYSKVSY